MSTRRRTRRKRWFYLLWPLLATIGIVTTVFLIVRSPGEGPQDTAHATPIDPTGGRVVLPKGNITYDDVAAILDAQRANLPPTLQGKAADALAASWTSWAA